MKIFRQMRIFALVFAVLALASGFNVLNTSGSLTPDGCCWVLFCTLQPPIVCWEECRPMPYIPKAE